jgi:hypothetical protein
MPKTPESDLLEWETLPQSILVETLKTRQRLDCLEKSIRAHLEREGPVQEGNVTAFLRSSVRKNPAWKHAFIAALGEKAADAVMASTPEVEVTSMHIEVVGQALSPAPGPTKRRDKGTA